MRILITSMLVFFLVVSCGESRDDHNEQKELWERRVKEIDPPVAVLDSLIKMDSTYNADGN